MCATNLIRPVSACVPVCSSPSLLTTTDTVLAHGSGHVALFLMCPHSTHLLYQQCEGCKCKAAAEQVMNLEYSVSLFLSLALWLGVHMETNLWLLIITAEMAANTGNWHGLSSVPISAVKTGDRNRELTIFTLYLEVLWKLSLATMKKLIKLISTVVLEDRI